MMCYKCATKFGLLKRQVIYNVKIYTNEVLRSNWNWLKFVNWRSDQFIVSYHNNFWLIVIVKFVIKHSCHHTMMSNMYYILVICYITWIMMKWVSVSQTKFVKNSKYLYMSWTFRNTFRKTCRTRYSQKSITHKFVPLNLNFFVILIYSYRH